MREILFRAKRIDGGKWVEGYLFRLFEELHPFIMVKNRGGLGYEVDENTICQYTGLTDKNGKKIFEGDIFKGKKVKAYSVEYRDKIAGFAALGEGVLSTPCMNCGTMKNYEVIGNIFDNPEFLEGGAE